MPFSIVEAGDTKIYMSQQHAKVYETMDNRMKELHPQNATHGFLKRRLFKEMVDVNALLRNLNGYSVLEAHGDSDETGWAFRQGRRWYFTQSWVDSMDGQSAALLVLVCNPAAQDLTSQQSVVIYPNRDLNLPEARNLRGHMRMFVPDFGHFDNNYHQLKRAADKLKARVK